MITDGGRHLANTLSIGTVLSDRYEIKKILGHGGMGAVYLASDRRLTVKQWAVKETIFDYDSQDERIEIEKLFIDEAHILARLDHPNLPKVVDFFSEGDHKYLVMEYIEGETLEKIVLGEKGYLPVDKVIHYGLQIAEVLDYLHNRKPNPIIFRDLKPSNVMVTADNRVKLIDFGIARIFTSGKDKDTIILGTPGYAPPEQYGKSQTNERSDIFSFGATLYFVLTKEDPGKSPFHFPPITNFNSNVPKELEEVILKAVSIAPESRYSSMKEIIIELKRISPGNKNLYTTLLGQSADKSSTGPVDNSQVLDKTNFPIEFKPNSLDFGTMKRGSVRSISFTIMGDVKGTIKTDKKWLKIKPSSVKGVNPVVDAVVDSVQLRHGGNFLGNIILFSKKGDFKLPVNVKIETQPLSIWSYIIAFLLTTLSLIPLLGFVSFFLMLWLYFSVPIEDRGVMWVFMIISTVISIIWLLVILVAVYFYLSVQAKKNLISEILFLAGIF